jgi:hypothetical protein
MRRTLLIFTLFALFLIFGFSATALAFVEISPFHPGQMFFPVQNSLDHVLVIFYLDHTSKSNYEMDILEKRISDLNNAAGQSEEISGINSVLVELDHVLNHFQKIPPEAEASLRKRFVDILISIQDQIPHYTYSAGANPKEFGAFQAKIAGLKFLAMDVSNSLTTLYAINSQSNPAMEQANNPSTSRTAQPGLSDSRMIPFLPGSAGASHAFFPLTGKHAALSCQSCHTSVTYAGTPNQCATCHSDVIPENHYEAECSLCHTTGGWIPANFDHSVVNTSNCQSCHSVDKPANHFDGQCSSCHNSNAWKPATFNHAAVGATNCVNCHSSDKPANHFDGQCSSCHSTNAWKPATFNHAAVGATNCVNCHTSDKPANHFDGQCSSCHTTNAWKPAIFNHAAVGAVDCQSCHSSDRPANHYSGQCSSCHTTSGWRPATFNHSSANTDCQSCHSGDRPANHYSGQCSSCHTTSGWRPATFNHSSAYTDCQSCHSGDRPANHFSGQCSSCHTTSGWRPATFSHSFPLNHGGANGVCAQCHPSGGSDWTCFNCHNENELTQKHQEEGIPDYVIRCMECHADGRKHDD